MRVDNHPLSLDTSEQECLVPATVNLALVLLDQCFEFNVCNDPGIVSLNVRVDI